MEDLSPQVLVTQTSADLQKKSENDLLGQMSNHCTCGESNSTASTATANGLGSDIPPALEQPRPPSSGLASLFGPCWRFLPGLPEGGLDVCPSKIRVAYFRRCDGEDFDRVLTGLAVNAAGRSHGRGRHG